MPFVRILVCGFWLATLGAGWAQDDPNLSGVPVRDEPPTFGTPLLSPPASTSVKIKGKKITIRYSAPSMRKRLIFGGLEPYHKVWRAGANDATSLHTEAELEVGGLTVPKGDYTLFVWLDPTRWLLIVNTQTGQSGLSYDQTLDLGRVPMTMSRPPKPIERFKIALSRVEDDKGQLQLAWENTIASVQFRVKSGR